MTEKHEARNAWIVSRIKGAPCVEGDGDTERGTEGERGGGRRAPGRGSAPTGRARFVLRCWGGLFEELPDSGWQEGSGNRLRE